MIDKYKYLITMKRKAIIGVGLLLVAAVAAWYVFLRRGSQSYTHALPADMKAVASVDMSRLARESGLDAARLQELVFADRSVDDTGLDFAEKIYAFVSPDDCFGVVAAVADAKQLRKTLDALHEEGHCEAVDEQRGFAWTTIEGQWLAAFDDDKLLVMGPAMGSALDELRNRMATYLRQDEAESGAATPMFSELGEQQGAVALVSQLGVLPASYSSMLRTGLPKEVDPQDVRMAASLEVAGNRLALHVALLSDHPEMQKLIREAETLFRPIQGDLATLAPPQALLWMGANVNGEKLLEELRKEPTLRTALIMLNMGIDVDLILKSIDGDLSVAVEALDGNLSVPTVLTAQLARTDFLKNVDYWKRSLGPRSDVLFRDLGNNRFYFSMGAQGAYFGVKDKCLYVANDERLAASALVPQTASTVAPYRGEMKGCRWYLTVDLTQLWQQAGGLLAAAGGASATGWVQRAQTLLARLVIKVPDMRHVDVELYAPEGTNLMKECFK